MRVAPSLQHCRHSRESGNPGFECLARFARDLNSYLWVADPRQVAFLCLPKEKRPKERAPRSCRHLPALLGKIGARLTRRALSNAPRAQTRGSLLPIFPAMLGGGYGDPKTPRSRGFFSTPYGAPEHRQALGGRPQGRAQGSARLAHEAGSLVGPARDPKPRSAGEVRHSGVLSLGDFSLHEQREVTQGAGAEPPASSCLIVRGAHTIM